MDGRLKGRDFLTLLDYTADEIRYLLDLSAELKYFKHNRVSHAYLGDLNVALIFEKTSTRTRSSFEVAAHDLGMGSTYIGPGSSQLQKKESVADTARVLSRMYDAIEYRGFDQEIVETLAEYADVPVWNGLTTEYHPTQALADMLTIREEFGGLAGRKVVFMGDAGNNVANSLMVACAKLGLDYVACAPASQQPDPTLVRAMRREAEASGGSVEVTDDVRAAVAGAHVVYTDIWVSMGEPYELWERRIKLLAPYRVTSEVMGLAADDAIFMHCLPSFHNTDTTVAADIAERFGVTEMEVTDEVFEGPRSRVFDEAENRLHTIKAVMLATLAPDDLYDLG